MKVLIHGDGSAVNGAERQAVLLAQGLRGRGHDVIVSCPPATPFADLLHERNVPAVHVRPRGNLDPFSALRFARWIRAERPDVFLATSWKRALSVGWAARAAGVGRIVLRVGGSKPPGPRSAAWRTRQALLRYTDAVIGNSGSIAQFLHERYPFFPERELHVVWNAVERQDTTNSMVRRELRIGSAPLVLAVGGLTANKSHELLLDAFARLPVPEAQLAVAGWGPLADELKRKTANLGLDARVHWLGRRSDVPKLLGAANVFVLTSRHEGTANALLEAMAAGVPVISTPIAGSEIAVAAAGGRPDAGWIVPFQDPVALAAALAHVLKGAPDVEPRVAEARWRAEHWFSIERMVSGYEAVLRGGQQYNDETNHLTLGHAHRAR